jgi:hypothetical protein
MACSTKFATLSPALVEAELLTDAALLKTASRKLHARKERFFIAAIVPRLQNLVVRWTCKICKKNVWPRAGTYGKTLYRREDVSGFEFRPRGHGI